MYIEGVDIGKDHQGTTFLSYLDFEFLDVGGEDEVAKLTNPESSFLKGLKFDYAGGSDARFKVDRFTTSDNTLFECENNFGRMHLNKRERFRVISSSILIGALKNGEGLNTKAYLIGEMVNYFLGLKDPPPPPSLVENTTGNGHAVRIYPNPFNEMVHILVEASNDAVEASVFDLTGKQIARLETAKIVGKTSYQLEWDARNNNGEEVLPGMYFCKIQVGNKSYTKKIVLSK